MSTCPDGQMSNQTSIIIDSVSVDVLVCVDCLHPCANCNGLRHNCTSCVSGYHFYVSINRCFLDCPDNTTI